MAEHIDNPAGQLPSDVYYSQPANPNPGEPIDALPDSGLGNQATPQDSVEPSAQVNDSISANLFSVDETGFMAYILRSNLHIEHRLNLATQRGRTPEGIFHLGAGLHTVEDFFAHSNWIAIAIEKTLDDNPEFLKKN
jgi:hypothetical protein